MDGRRPGGSMTYGVPNLGLFWLHVLHAGLLRSPDS
jgi:hypothetical protein